MASQVDLEVVKRRFVELGIFDHDGYGGPATKEFTVTTQHGRFLIVGADKDSEWQDDVDSVVEYVRTHGTAT